MIICFCEKINSFIKNNLKSFKENELQDIMPTLEDVKDQKCPYCKRKNSLVKYGHYGRHISFYHEHEIQDFYVQIQRVKCKSCNKTHALLPHFVIPYVIMAVFSIAEIVSTAAKSSAYKLSQISTLSHQLIYTYIAMVISFFNDYKILNNKKEYVNKKNFNEKYFKTNCVDLSDENHRIDFFEFHNWILFMQKFRNNSSPKVRVFISKMPST